MTSIRIPVSLKFDTSTDFYNDFIYVMREDRTLSDFIVNILRAYYENHDVREVVDNVLGLYDPLAELKKQVQRAQLEHMKVVMATSMMEHQLSKAENYLKENINNSASNEVVRTDNSLEARVESLEKLVAPINEKLNMVLSMLQQGGYNSISLSSQPANNSSPHNQSEVNNALNIVSNQENVEKQTATNLAPSVEKQDILPSAPTLQPEIEVATPIHQVQQVQPPQSVQQVQQVSTSSQPASAPIIIVDEPEEQEDTRKPASFGKAFKSIKRK